MKVLGWVFATLLFSSVTYAQSYGAFGGFNSTIYDNDSTDFERSFGLEIGFTASIPLQSSLSFRTGAGFVGKNSSVDNGPKFGLTFLELPATLMFRASPSVRIFGGLNLDILISDSCKVNSARCSADGETLMVTLPLGARINIEGPHSIEPIIEFGMTDAVGTAKVSNSLSIRYVYMFVR